MKEIIDVIKKNNNLRYEFNEEKLIIYNIDNDKSIEIIKEIYSSEKDSYYEYIVSFATQHCHFSDDYEDVLDYINDIMNDEVLPIEFYLNGKNIFGGELSRKLFDNISVKSLANYFRRSEEDIINYDYEVHSWSGKYDIKRQPVANI